MCPHPPVTESLLERSQADLLLLLSLCWIIQQDAAPEDMDFSGREDCTSGQESRARIAEGVRKEETKDETGEAGEGTHQSKQPKPARATGYSTHMKYTKRQELGRSLAKLVSKVEDHHTLSSLFSSVPGGDGPETARDKSRLSNTEEESRCDK